MTKEFETFYTWANQNLELNLAAYKEQQLQRRIYTVMGQAGATSLEQYSALLEKDEEVRQRFLDYITINVTDFFRNPDLFNEFEEILLKDLSATFGKLKIWSAACSIGSEPYSLAMLVKRNNLQLENKILATDIDTKVLNRAREGIYKEYELKNINSDIINSYFKKEDQQYLLEPTIKQMVQFKKHDLLVDPFQKNFHAIICRNVIIYFKKEVKEKLYEKFSESLIPGGVLFTGATETIYKPELYGLEKIGKFIYQKQEV